MILGIIAVVVILVLVFVKMSASSAAMVQQPPHLRQPIQKGCYRVVGHDDLPGGDELTNVVGDYTSFDEALKEAQAGRADSELKVGHKGQPARFMIYDDKGQLAGDWKGRK